MNDPEKAKDIIVGVVAVVCVIAAVYILFFAKYDE